MSSDECSLWRDPLFSPGDGFPLGPPLEFWADCADPPSTIGVRPYSLHGVVPVPSGSYPDSVTYDYDADRQITTVRCTDGSSVTLARHTKPGPTPASTSGYTDGDPKNPPPEEMGQPDYQAD